MSSRTRQQLEQYLKTIDVNAGRVLDFGGSQNPIKGRTRGWNVNEYRIADLKAPHQVKVWPDYIFDLNEYFDLGENANYYDVVFCIEVSEYFYDPMQAARNLYKVLKPGGLLYISFHFIYSQHLPAGKDYLRYTPAGAETILTKSGFQILEHKMRRSTLGNVLGNFYGQEGMRGDKEADHMIVGSIIKAKKT